MEQIWIGACSVDSWNAYQPTWFPKTNPKSAVFGSVWPYELKTYPIWSPCWFLVTPLCIKNSRPCLIQLESNSWTSHQWSSGHWSDVVCVECNSNNPSLIFLQVFQFWLISKQLVFVCQCRPFFLLLSSACFRLKWILIIALSCWCT